jgi:hypothetical protein
MNLPMTKVCTNSFPLNEIFRSLFMSIGCLSCYGCSSTIHRSTKYNRTENVCCRRCFQSRLLFFKMNILSIVVLLDSVDGQVSYWYSCVISSERDDLIRSSMADGCGRQWTSDWCNTHRHGYLELSNGRISSKTFLSDATYSSFE